ncbi:hypothetical protein K8R30_00575 [archaeon]|nr:hypothetical protein [archaeon]
MKYVAIGAAVILVVFLAVLSQIPLGIEPLTELYFEEHTQLPSSVSLNEIYNFAFTTNNLEYQDMRYYYNVSVFDVNGSFVKSVGFGDFVIEHNESRTVEEGFLFAESFERAKIKVLIKKDHMNITPEFKTKLWWPDPNYPTEIDVHFWVDEVVV